FSSCGITFQRATIFLKDTRSRGH
ncbi:hypothetical protein V3C99_008156, partial [Haemonchus contortus]